MFEKIYTMEPNELVYLRSDVLLEPLFDQWYAWSYLIPPATAARNITHRHLPIMDSYIKSPVLHSEAVRNPKFIGGPFIDYPRERVEDIKHLRELTTYRCKALLSLSAAIQKLEDLLRGEAKGFSLHPLYPRVPQELRGLVELVYDLNGQASFRLIEPLLYKSKYYRPDLQSIMLSIAASDDRPFTLSTPRLPTQDAITLQIPFNDRRIDLLSELKLRPRPVLDIVADLDLDERQAQIFRRFLTVNKPQSYASYSGRGARWRYFGHACILLETLSCSILFDPVISYNYKNTLPRYTYSDLPPVIDYVVITHNHQDHVLFETLLQLRHRIRHIIVPHGNGKLQDPSLRLMLETIGFTNVIELAEMQELLFQDVAIIGIPFLGEHADLDIQSKLAYLVRVSGKSLLFGADSCNIEEELYENIHQIIGDVDALFLGMECDGAPLSWLYGPLLTQHIERSKDSSRRLSGSNFEQANRIVRLFSCKEVYVYAMGQEPWLNYIMSIKYTDTSNPIVQSNALLRECVRLGIKAERLFGEREILID